MRALVEQTLAEGRVRERRSRAISRVFDIALPVLIVLCLLLWRERYNVIEVKKGEISLMQVYAWGCCARELSRMPTSEIASVSVEKVCGTRGGGGFKGVRIYDRAGNVFSEMCFGDNTDRAHEEKNLLNPDGTLNVQPWDWHTADSTKQSKNDLGFVLMGVRDLFTELMGYRYRPGMADSQRIGE